MNSLIKYLWLMAASGAALAAGQGASTDPQAKLAALRAHIAALTTRFRSELKDRDALGARLRSADLGITEAQRRLESLREAELAAERRRAELRVGEARAQAALTAQRSALAAQVRAAYLIGHREELALLLNLRDPSAVGRMTTYYGYFARERAAKIDGIRTRMSQLHELVVQSEQTGAQLQGLHDDARRELEGLQRARAERATALIEVSQRVRSGTEELARLKHEEQQEEALVADLAQVLQDLPVDAQQDFGALRGKLPWPVPGRIAARFQDVRAAAGSGWRSNGVLIEAAAGAKVRAPCFGRVVYADWLQGLGLLLIIGHNGNYMTLYGHAEVLYKSVGDWVVPGDLIAALSTAGGASPQLYFEIRAGRTPEDPKRWLRSSP